MPALCAPPTRTTPRLVDRRSPHARRVRPGPRIHQGKHWADQPSRVRLQRAVLRGESVWPANVRKLPQGRHLPRLILCAAGPVVSVMLCGRQDRRRLESLDSGQQLYNQRAGRMPCRLHRPGRPHWLDRPICRSASPAWLHSTSCVPTATHARIARLDSSAWGLMQ